MARKYSVNFEEGELVSVEVDGVVYDDPDQIPDPDDREQILELISKTQDEEFDRAFEDFDQEFKELESQQAKFPFLIVGIFGLVALITLTIAVISGISTSRSIAREQSAPGKVVDLILRTSPGGRDSQGTYTPPQDYYYPIVEFTLPDGTLKTVQLNEGSWPPAYEKGEAVTVLYDPDKPIHARIQSTSSNILLWLLPGITGVVGLGFLIAAAGVAWFFKPAKPAASPNKRDDLPETAGGKIVS